MKKKFTYANIMATIAVVLALSIGAVPIASAATSAVRLVKNSVTGVHIKDGTIRLVDINSVDRKKLQGAKGATGATGAAGQTGATGQTGAAGQTGATGATGPQGERGDTGLRGLTGIQGNDGPPGADGTSAYDLAVELGYNGSFAQWLESLEGKSAYEVAVANGYVGTEVQWLDSLNFTFANIRVTGTPSTILPAVADNSVTSTASCPATQRLLGGGYTLSGVSSSLTGTIVRDAAPLDTQTYSVTLLRTVNGSSGATVTAYALCYQP